MRNFKRCIYIIAALLCIIVVNEGLNYLLYPYTYSRADMHHLITQDYQDLLVGTSHGKCGLDPKALAEKTGHRTLNVCQGGEYPQDAYFLVREAARHRNISRVIYELDSGYWVSKPAQSPDYITFYHEMPNSVVKAEYFMSKIVKADFRTSMFPWYYYRKQITKIGDTIHQKNSRVYKEYGEEPFCTQVQTYRKDGFFARHPIESDKTQEDTPVLWNQKNLNKNQQSYFEKMVDFCGKKGIELVVVTTPVPKVTYEKYRSSYDGAVAYFTKYLKEKGVKYYNYINSKETEEIQDLAQFADYEGHMYEKTAEKFSHIFGEKLVISS
jgi:hypothetical protein